MIGYRYEMPSERLDVTVQARIETRDLDRRTCRPRPRCLRSSAKRVCTRSMACRTRASKKWISGWRSLVLEKYFRDDDGNRQAVAVPDELCGHRTALADEECLTCKDNAFPQMLLLARFAHDAADRIYRAIVASVRCANTHQADSAPVRSGRLDAVCGFRHDAPDVSDRSATSVTFRTSSRIRGRGSKRWRRCWKRWTRWCATSRIRTSVSRFRTRLNGEERGYIPDYIVRINDGHGADDLLNLDSRSERRGAQGQGGESRNRAHAVGSRNQQSRRIRALGISRNLRSVGCEEYDPRGIARQRKGTARAACGKFRRPKIGVSLAIDWLRCFPETHLWHPSDRGMDSNRGENRNATTREPEARNMISCSMTLTVGTSKFQSSRGILCGQMKRPRT